MRHRRSRGVALLVVLAILAIALALVYAVSRSSVTQSKMSVHEGASLEARCAAEAAAAIALEHFTADANWMPDANPMTGTHPTGEPYEVDVQLTNDGRDRSLAATAQVIDPQQQRTQARFALTVKLARQRRDNFPTAAITAFVTQANNGGVPPIADPGDLYVAETDPSTTSTVYNTNAATVYVAKGTTIRGNIRSKGPIYFQKGFKLDGQTYVLGDTASDRTESSGYQNYRTCWGAAYQPQLLSGLGDQSSSGSVYLSDVTLGPSSQNPMGVYYHDGDVVLGDDVNILGTLVCKGNVSIGGSGIHLFALQKATNPETGAAFTTSYPAVVADGSITFEPSADVVRIAGLVLAGGTVTRRSDPTQNLPGNGTGIVDGRGKAVGLANGDPSDHHNHKLTIDAIPDPFGTSDGPAIYIKGAILAGRVRVENQPGLPFALVFDAATTDTTDAPGFFTWKLSEWAAGN